MDYEEFKEQFIEEVKERLSEQGSDMNVSVNEVKKLNESYEAMTVTPEGARVGVNVGIERFYEAYDEGRSFDEVVDKAVETINRGINERPDFDIDSFTDYDQMKEKLAMEVVSAETNKEMLENVPHKVRNIKQYLLAAIYNAPLTLGPYYQAWVNNDREEGYNGGKEIALDQDKSYDTVKKRLVRLRTDLRDAVIDCLEMNCQGGV